MTIERDAMKTVTKRTFSYSGHIMRNNTELHPAVYYEGEVSWQKSVRKSPNAMAQ